MPRGAAAQLQVLSDAKQLGLALSPLRRQMLSLLEQPDSAVGLARRLHLPRQRVNYHLRELERAGLVELVQERRRRGAVERQLQATARAWVIDPSLLATHAVEAATVQDRFSSAYLVSTAAHAISAVAELRERAEATQRRLATLTVETEIAFGSPRELRAFARDLQACIAELAQRYQRAGGRRYQVIALSYPRAASKPTEHAQR
jgi:DNA-binding transcriptional ArsR family regulator